MSYMEIDHRYTSKICMKYCVCVTFCDVRNFEFMSVFAVLLEAMHRVESPHKLYNY
jgi:hypothetical protein